MKIRVFVSASSDLPTMERVCSIYLERQYALNQLHKIDQQLNPTDETVEEKLSEQRRIRNLQEEIAKFDIEIENLKRRIIHGANPWPQFKYGGSWSKNLLAQASNSLLTDPSALQSIDPDTALELAKKLSTELKNSVRIIVNWHTSRITELLVSCVEFYLKLVVDHAKDQSVIDLREALDLYEQILSNLYRKGGGLPKTHLKTLTKIYRV